ncbi:putative MFS transporter, YNFM family, membrane transport protein [Azospirillaceae bacterium]
MTLKERQNHSMTSSLALPSSRLGGAGGLTLSIACAATALPCASVYMTQPIFPEIAIGLNIGDTDARLVFTITSVAYAFAFFLFGPLSDRYPARAVATWGCVAQAAATATAAQCDGFWEFLAASAMIGVIAAAIPAAMYALIGRLATGKALGACMGLVVAASVVGVILGRSMTGVICAIIGWRATFLGMAGLYLLLPPLLTLLPNDAELAATHRPALKQSYINTLKLLTFPPSARLLAIGFFTFVGYLGVLSILTFHLKRPPFSYNAAQIGWISLMGLSAVLGAPLSGALMNRVGARRVLLVGHCMIITSLGLLGVAEDFSFLIAGVLLMFLGVFAGQPVIFTLLARTVPQECKGASSSLYFLVCLGSGGLSTAALGPAWTFGGWSAVIALGSAAVILAMILGLIATKQTPSDTPVNSPANSPANR